MQTPRRRREYNSGYRATHKKEAGVYAAEHRAPRRAQINAIKVSVGCADCGYREHPAALDFDHLPGYTKLFGIGNNPDRSWVSLEAEMAKCEVVCANCHRVRTFNRRLTGRSDSTTLKAQAAQETGEAHE
jgi:hypothetical protein